MLYLTRKPGETIVIEENIEITVVSVSGKSVKLGFTFPEEVSILRKEVFDRIQSENRAAAGTAFNPATFNLALSSSVIKKSSEADKTATEKSTRPLDNSVRTGDTPTSSTNNQPDTETDATT